MGENISYITSQTVLKILLEYDCLLAKTALLVFLNAVPFQMAAALLSGTL